MRFERQIFSVLSTYSRLQASAVEMVELTVGYVAGIIAAVATIGKLNPSSVVPCL